MSETEQQDGQFKDRRRHPRFRFEVAVILVASGEIDTVEARDLGAGGIYLRGRTVPPMGARVQVQFTVGKDRRFSIWGKVIRQDHASVSKSVRGFAVEFEAPVEVTRVLAQALEDAERPQAATEIY